MSWPRGHQFNFFCFELVTAECGVGSFPVSGSGLFGQSTCMVSVIIQNPI